MNNDAIYLAGFLEKDPEKEVIYLKMIHNSGDRRPYLTHNANGLKLTRHHANLYVLSQDHSKIRCVQPCNNPFFSMISAEINLSDEDRARIQEAITPTTFSVKEETT